MVSENTKIAGMFLIIILIKDMKVSVELFSVAIVDKAFTTPRLFLSKCIPIISFYLEMTYRLSPLAIQTFYE